MKCRICGSDSHLLKQCRNASPAQLVYQISSISANEKDQMDNDDILNHLQNIPDQQWYGEATEDDGTNIMEIEDSDDEMPDVLYATLADNSVRHELGKTKTEKEAQVFFADKGDTGFDGIVLDHGA